MTDWKAKTPEQEVIRAGEARQILESPLFKEMRASIEQTLSDRRRSVPLNETDMHTKLIITEQLWGSLMDFFEQTAQSGKIAEVQIQQTKNRLAQVAQIFRR